MLPLSSSVGLLYDLCLSPEGRLPSSLTRAFVLSRYFDSGRSSCKFDISVETRHTKEQMVTEQQRDERTRHAGRNRLRQKKGGVNEKGVGVK